MPGAASCCRFTNARRAVVTPWLGDAVHSLPGRIGSQYPRTPLAWAIRTRALRRRLDAPPRLCKLPPTALTPLAVAAPTLADPRTQRGDAPFTTHAPPRDVDSVVLADTRTARRPQLPPDRKTPASARFACRQSVPCSSACQCSPLPTSNTTGPTLHVKASAPCTSALDCITR